MEKIYEMQVGLNLISAAACNMVCPHAEYLNGQHRGEIGPHISL
jgi:hypothetical protein